MTDPTIAEVAAPTIPYLVTSGIMLIANPKILTRVTMVTYSCFFAAKKSGVVDPDIDLIMPKIAKTLTAGTAESHFIPNAIITISFVKKKSISPKGIEKTDIIAITLKNANLSLFLSSIILI